MKWLIKVCIGVVMFVAFILLYSYFFKGAPALWLFADIPALLFLILFTEVITRINYTLKEELSFFRLVLKEVPHGATEDPLLERGIAFFKHLEGVSFLSAGVISIWATVSLLAYLEDSATVGHNLATALLVFLYAGILNLLLFRPCRVRLSKRLLNQ